MHSILSIGSVNFLHPKMQFYMECMVPETAEIDPGSLHVNGFTEEGVRDPRKKSEAEVIREWLLWRDKCYAKRIAGQNISFDLSFIGVAARRAGIKFECTEPPLDLRGVYSKMYRRARKSNLSVPGFTDRKASRIYDFVGLPDEPHPHNALNGAKWEAEAFSRLLYGTRLLPEFSGYGIPRYLGAFVAKTPEAGREPKSGAMRERDAAYRGYAPWDEEQDAFLEKEFHANKSGSEIIKDIKERFGVDRSTGAIRSRLEKHGLIDAARASMVALQTKLPANSIELNAELRSVLSLMEGSRINIFITGKAGTGKSTLLTYFKSITSKRIAVLAPTGVAALNVMGQTVHSFCRFKPGITPETVEKLRGVPFSTINMYRSLDMIVIDEISMVRADLLDCLDRFMRLNGNNPQAPFGGVQMVFVGDLYQLPPVVPEDEGDIFNGPYKSPYFFDSAAFNALDVRFVELKGHYRQSDPEFIRLLNAIRDNTASEKDLEELNSKVEQSHVILRAPYMYITLTTTNSIADGINSKHLDMMPSKLYSYNASVTGKFSKNAYPADEVLYLKEGAQVMMLNNDPKKRWVNGSLGAVTSIERDRIWVELSDGKRVSVEPCTWETSKLSYDSANRRLVSTSTGSFVQYPLMLAWAVTIHKSQGKTFDHVVIDIGSGTFAPGQLYVALSRCTRLEGITLKRKLRMEYIITDRRVAEFHKAHFG